ncbi:MAG: glycoside hydrolase family 97 N-terminal domain-containing protein [Bacteroides thetaiotaomicron]
MDKKKISYLILLCLFSLSCTLQAEKYETVSPNGKLKIKLKIDKGTQYEVWYDNTQLILPSPIGLHLADGKSNRQRKCKVGKEKKGESDYRRPCW